MDSKRDACHLHVSAALLLPQHLLDQLRMVNSEEQAQYLHSVLAVYEILNKETIIFHIDFSKEEQKGNQLNSYLSYDSTVFEVGFVLGVSVK